MPKAAAKESAVAVEAGVIFSERYKNAMAILNRALDESRDELSVLESADLQSLMNWHPSDSAKELRRLAKRRHWLSVAGTPQDRESAVQAIADAKRIYETRSPSIQAEIDRLTRELARLESDVSRSEKRHAEMLSAVEASKQTMPREMVNLLSRQRAEIKNRLYPAVSAIETELQHCRVIAEFDPVIHREQHSRVPAKFWTTDAELRKPTLKREFFEYQSQCRARIAGLEAELLEATAKLNGAIAEHDSKIDSLNW